jgi:serine/threonine-protein kinase
MRWAVLWGALWVAFSPARAARAQEADAEALTKQGLELRRQRHDAEALAVFRRAYAVKATPRTLAQIALAEQALGKWVDAEADLDAALGSTDDAWIAPHRSTLLGGLATIRSHLGWLEVTADAPAAAAARLWVNGADMGELPLAKPVRVEAGSVVVEVRATGFVPARRVPFVEPGGSAREAVHLVPLALEPPAAVPDAHGPPASAPPGTTELARRAPESEGRLPTSGAPRTAGDARARYAGYVALGAGAVGLGLGTYFGIRTFEKKSERDQVCPTATCSSGTDGVALDQRARVFATQSTAWFVGGAVAAVAGAVLMWTSRSRSVDTHGATLRVVPQLGAERAGASLEFGGSW